MIVNIGAWFYLVNAGLALLSIPLSPIQFASPSTLLAFVFAGVFGAMGYGLLQREKWARWMALGCSLLGWTLGGLLLIALIGYLLFAVKVGVLIALLLVGGLISAFAWLVVLTIVLWAAGVYISFRLFWHLCSPEGCEEFGEPPITAPTLVASAGAWLGLVLVNYLATPGDQFVQDMVNAGGPRASQEDPRSAELREAERQRILLEREAQRAAEASARREAEINAQLEAAIAEAAVRADAAQAEPGAAPSDEADPGEMASQPEGLDASPGGEVAAPIEESLAPESPPAAAAPAETKDSETPSSRKIIKCRDSSGGITFTQGYCPPGSKQVDMD